MPSLRTDIIDVYVFRRGADGRSVEFLQLRRAKGPLVGTWQPVMGHVHEGETAAATALRELKEETGFAPPALVGFWQLEEVNTFFLASRDAVVLSAGFAVEVSAGAEPVLNDEHDGARWVKRDHVDLHFTWPGQRQAIAAICRDILPAASAVREMLRLPIPAK